MKRVAVYSHSVAPSIDGVCRRYTAILHELVRQGYDVLLFTIETDPKDIPEGVTYVTLDYMIMPAYPGKKVVRPTWGVFGTIFRALQEYRPDCIHMTNDGVSNIFAACALMLGIPIVGAFHTDILQLLQRHGGTLFQQGCVYTKELTDSWLLDSCATTSKSFREKLAENYISCQHIIVTAVDTQVFSASKASSKLRSEMTFGDKKGFLCAYVGRISREKRIDVLIEAVQQIPGCYLAIVGDGPSASIYAKLHGKENRIFCRPQFLEHTELAEVYASCDLHVSASEFETLGNTVLEAHACGVPVVVPMAQGFCDTVHDKVDGFLFEPGNASSAMEYIVRFKEDNKLRERMGRAGLKAIQSNTIHRVVKDLLDWYALGIGNYEAKSAWTKFWGFILLLCIIPFSIFSLRCYSILVRAPCSAAVCLCHVCVWRC